MMQLLKLRKGRAAGGGLLVFFMLGLLPLLAVLALWLVLALGINFPGELPVSVPLLLVLTAAGYLGVIFTGGWLVHRRLALPIRHLAQGIKIITEEDSRFRIPALADGGDIGTLAESINRMADHLCPEEKSCIVEQRMFQAMLKRREAEFNVIAQVSALANRSLDLPGNLSFALEIVKEAIKTDFLAIFLTNPAGDLVFTASRAPGGYEDIFRQHCKDMVDLTIMQRAVQQREMVYIPDINRPYLGDPYAGPPQRIELSTEQYIRYARLDVTRIAFQPIIASDQVLGVIVLMRHPSPEVPQEEVSFLDTYVDHLATIIRNSQIQAELHDHAIMEERRRLASELHDSVTQSLFSLGMAAESLKSTLQDAPEEAQMAVRLIDSQRAAIQTELRSLINELRPLDLRHAEGLDHALQRHVSSLRQVAGCDARLEISGDPRRLPIPVQQTLNRIIQEALSNVARHAKAGRVEVRLEIGPAEVALTVADDGEGFDPQSAAVMSSYGLVSMRDRAELMGGTFEICSAPGAGTSVVVRLPRAAAGMQSLPDTGFAGWSSAPEREES